VARNAARKTRYPPSPREVIKNQSEIQIIAWINRNEMAQRTTQDVHYHVGKPKIRVNPARLRSDVYGIAETYTATQAKPVDVSERGMAETIAPRVDSVHGHGEPEAVRRYGMVVGAGWYCMHVSFAHSGAWKAALWFIKPREWATDMMLWC
jgi:hypothetical protein